MSDQTWIQNLVEQYAVLKNLLHSQEGFHVVFINGHFAGHSPLSLPKGAILSHISSVLKQHPELLPNLPPQPSDGVFVLIPEDTQIEKPIFLDFVSIPNSQPIDVHSQNLIFMSPYAQSSIIENYSSLTPGAYSTHAVTKIVLAEGANLDHYQIQQEGGLAKHSNDVSIQQNQDSQYRSHAFALGSGLVCNNLQTTLAAPGASCMLNGLFLGEQKQRMDFHTTIDHAQPHCTSEELYKGILGGQAQGTFKGRIVVRPHAQKTSARQTNKNLLLSEEALINTEPILEIFANDVKCNHGATIGRLDESQLFYLTSRGIHRKLAQQMLIHAFASDLLATIPLNSVRHHIQTIISEHLTKWSLCAEAA
ncbi:MAG: Fe-S cluster assembly protein SufD [Deltaproteobacteria bacterium]|nr:Fe-S cluster assembly protein SufD [Deltaproteobacteria bacterium]